MNTTYIEGWKMRAEEERRREKVRVQSARAELPKAIAILQRYGVKRIILFGSLAQGDRMRPDSDIDLAVEGLNRMDFLRAYADLLFELEWPIDLKPIEDIKGYLRETILEQGRIIYEREKTDIDSRG